MSTISIRILLLLCYGENSNAFIFFSRAFVCLVDHCRGHSSPAPLETCADAHALSPVRVIHRDRRKGLPEVDFRRGSKSVTRAEVYCCSFTKKGWVPGSIYRAGTAMFCCWPHVLSTRKMLEPRFGKKSLVCHSRAQRRALVPGKVRKTDSSHRDVCRDNLFVPGGWANPLKTSQDVKNPSVFLSMMEPGSKSMALRNEEPRMDGRKTAAARHVQRVVWKHGSTPRAPRSWKQCMSSVLKKSVKAGTQSAGQDTEKS